MELTRRDAAAALAAIGATGGIAVGARRVQRSRDEASRSERDGVTDERIRTTMIAVAEVVYPDEVSGIDEFAGVFLDGRTGRQDHVAGIREAVSELNDLALSWYDGQVPELSVEKRDRLLREVGADTADEDPTGTTAEQVRYYVINELLLALYTSPKGGELIGIENPQGHPGGTESYEQGPR